MDGDETTQTPGQIVDAPLAVHEELAPGLLESAYEARLTYELVQRGFRVERQKILPLEYRGLGVECGYRPDLLVEDSVAVDIKSGERLDKSREARVLSYLKPSRLKAALSINFNVRCLKDGIRRFVY